MIEHRSAWDIGEANTVIERYEKRLAEFGYGEKALGWGEKGRQKLRFSILASQWDFSGKSVLDLGAGFGDFFAFIEPRGISSYLGIDITPGLVDEGMQRFSDDTRFNLKLGSATDPSNYQICDIAVISGLFNFRLDNGLNDEFIEQVLTLAWQSTTLGVACNFVTDQVDFKDPMMHYQSPLRTIEIANKFSRNLNLRQDYMPFEYSVFISHKQSFEKEIAVFNHILSK